MQDKKIIIGAILVAALAAFGIWSVVARNIEPPSISDTVAETGEVREFTIGAGNYYYSLEEMRVNAGDRVIINLVGDEGLHDLVIDEFDVATAQIRSGETDTIEFVANKRGEFEYYCSVGQHRELGQVGTLIVN